MTPTAIAQTVARLYTAAGRHYGQVELQVYAEALEDLDDELGTRAARDVIRGVDLGARAPSPRLVLDAAIAIRRREAADRPGLAEHTDPPLPPEENARRMGEAAARLRKSIDTATPPKTDAATTGAA